MIGVFKYIPVAFRLMARRDDIEKLGRLVLPILDLVMKVAPEAFPIVQRIWGDIRPELDTGQQQGEHDVMWLQGALNTIGVVTPPLAVDGEYGPGTIEAVKRFQQMH